MLSRFATIRNQGAAKCLIPMFQPATAVHTSAPFLSDVDISKKEFPPATSKRDFINYPRLVIKEERPPVRFGFIPDSWFQFFYPKTGYTGPYMFMISVGSYLFSKEKIIVDHNFMHLIAFVIALTILNKKVGPALKKVLSDVIESESKKIDTFQANQKVVLLENIKALETNEQGKKAIVEATTAKKELVLMQMEVAYRERIAETYKTIKKRLDCIAELENANQRNIQKNLIDYVLRNVHKSITPELEKNAMQNCISELNALASRT